MNSEIREKMKAIAVSHGLSKNAGYVVLGRAFASEMGLPLPGGKKSAKKLIMSYHGIVAEVVPRAPKVFRASARLNQIADEQHAKEVNSNAFLLSYEWRRLRMQALTKYGPVCQCCGADRSDGLKMHVDHIKPRKLYPQLALDITNLQILCEVCNHGKGNWDMTDWREQAAQHIGEISKK